MREIKFRAWDTEYKRWEKPDGISLKDGVAFSVTGDGYIDDIITNYPEYVIQQYTGLTDRHDVEIYEGDIVKELVGKKTYLGDKRSKRSGIGAITYGVYYATSDDPYCSAEVEGFHIDGEIFSSNLRDYSESELEVIGNIYEHSHLLENESKE